MPNYTTLLTTWGDSGTKYPSGYSYIEGEQPVDAWDNFLIHNVVKDLQSLIDTTNDDLLQRSGGSLASDLTVGDNALVSGAGSVDFSGTRITVDAILDVLQNLEIGGNILMSATGTVDGVDLSELKSDHDTLSGSHATLESSYGSHAGDNSAHHTRYADSEAISAINAQAQLSVDISGDANTLDGLDSSNFARLRDGVQAPVFATLGDVPAGIGKGELVFVEGEGKLFVEDGN